MASLYDEFAPRIYGYIYRRVSDPFVAEDLTGQTFEKALSAVRGNRAWRESVSGWLYRIAHNLVIDHYRARDRQHVVSLDDIPHLPVPADAGMGANPHRAAELALDGLALRSAIRRLTDEQAMVISLRFFEGYGFREIAEQMGKTEGAVKALPHRGVTSLRRIVGRPEIRDC